MRSDAVRLLPDEEATMALGGSLARRVRAGDLVLLEGPLGAGKTTTVRGLVAGLGGDPAEVCSPTFVLLERYEVCSGAIRRVHHADLYRVRGRSRAPWEEIGLDEVLDDPEGITAIEWPEGWSWDGLAGRVLVVRLGYRGTQREARLAWLSA